MFQKLFNPDNPLMLTMTQITDCIFLSLFWFVCSVPLVTLGASTAALYDAVYHAFRKGDKHSWMRFFRTFRAGLRGSAVSSVLFVLVCVMLGWSTVQLWNSAVYAQISWTLFAAGAFVIFTLIGILSLLFPMYSRFENPTFRLWSNTLRLSIGNLPLTLGSAAVNSLCIFLCVRYIFPVFFMPALTALISTVFIEPIFKPYMPQEDAA